MPTPVGHALAGLAVAWGVDALKPRQPAALDPRAGMQTTRLAIAAAIVAVLPDVDLFVGGHRGWTHSVGAALLAALFASVGARLSKFPVARTALVIGLACATHALLDWLGSDRSIPRGVMALWPFDTHYYFSPVTIFPRVERRYWLGWDFVRADLIALAFEGMVLGGVAGGIWIWKTRRETPERSRF